MDISWKVHGRNVRIFYTNLMKQHHLDMFSKLILCICQVYCIWHTLLNVYLHSTKLILHKVMLRSLIPRGLSDSPTQKKNQILFHVPLQNNIYV